MSIIHFKKYSENDLETIIFELKNLKAAIVDTDTIFGILCVDQNLIYKIKERSLAKKIVAFINDKNIIPQLSELEKQFLDKFWPGGVTVVKKSISYRIPNDKFILKLLEKFSVLYCSSANISSQNVINNIEQANEIFDVEKYYYDLFLIDHINKEKSGIESTIVDLDKWKILRHGYRVEEIEEFISHIKEK